LNPTEVKEHPMTDTKSEPTRGESIKGKTLVADTRVQGAQALLLQNHALTIESQPQIDFGKDIKSKELTALQSDMNNVLNASRSNARLYLKEVQPLVIERITQLDRYFNLEMSLARIIQNGDRATVLRNLRGVEDKARGFEADAKDVAGRMVNVRESLSKEAQAYTGFKLKLHEVVEGSEGAAKELDRQLREIDGKIGGAIAGAVVSGIAIAGGIFLVAVGSIAGFVTAGTSTPLVLLGGTIVVGGVAGAVGSGIAIAALVSQKNAILQQQATLTTQSRFASGLESTFLDLSSSATDAAGAAQQIANSWGMLSGHLKNLGDDLEAGRLDEDLFELFTTSADGDVKDIKASLQTIKTQMLGVLAVQPEGARLEDAISRAEWIANDNKAANVA